MKLTIPIIVAGAVAGAAAVTGGVLLVTTLSSGGPADPYVAPTTGDLRIVQQGAHSYDVSFELPDEFADASSGESRFEVQVTDSPDYQADAATDVAFTVAGDRVQLATTELEAGDHVVWLVLGDERTPVTVTIPDMAPRVWVAEGIPTIEFGESGDSSWSSYVDPEGKGVYRSSSPRFDADAEPLAEDLAITETSYRVDRPDAADPYYYLVFTGRGGGSTFVSSPIVATAHQGPLSVELVNDAAGPTYLISGFLGSRAEDDVERELRLRVGNFDPKNPASTFFVENAITDGPSGSFRFEVPARDLATGYVDLAVFLAEDGSTLEWSLDATGVDMSQRLLSEGSVFGIRRAEALQLTRVDLAYTSIDVRLTRVGETAQLQVSGAFTPEAVDARYQLIVKDSDGERHVASDQASTPARFSYAVDLGRLGAQSVWYDVEFFDSRTGETSPISTLSVRDMRQWVQTETRTYAFADYDGLLKVFFDVAPFADAHVELAQVDGVPSLVATGSLVGTDNGDAVLRIRSGDTVVQDVANTSTQRGTFRFVFDLRRLPEAGTWFDVMFRKPSTGSMDDFRIGAAADPAQTLEDGSRRFGIHEFNGQLKVAYDLIPGTVDVATATLVEVAGVPTLRVEGALDGLAASDAFLRVRSGAEIIDVPNTATAADRALFAFDLSGLSRPGVWYDLLIGSASGGTLVDVPSPGVDLTQRLTTSGHAYEFHDFGGQLKIAYDDVSVGVTMTAAELVEDAGVPTLRVTGTVAGTGGDDVFLRIRTGSTVIDVPNVATSPGAALFAVDLTGLTSAGTWYDILSGVGSTGSLVDVPESAADLTRTLLSAGRTYAFHEYDGDLKVAYDETPVSVATTSAVLVDVAGTPTLRVTGTYSGTTGDDLFLRVRTNGAALADVPNSSSTPGQSLFEYDLSGLSQAGTWYDLLVGATSSGQLVDLRDSIADLTTSLPAGSRVYSFHEYGHDLKVAFEAVAQAFVIDGAALVDDDGDPVLRVTGTLTGLAGSDVFLRVRAGSATVADIPNAATAAGEALFEYDLRGLSSSGTWYDLLAGVTSTGSLTDLSATVADLASGLELEGRGYSFHEYAGDLKVAFDAVPIAVTPTSAVFASVSGHPVLRVAGTVHGTTAADAFLRLTAAGQTIDVPNASTTAGQALFEYDLTGITDLGTAYELLTGVTSTGDLDVVPASVADLDDALSMAGHRHSFTESGGALRLLVEDAPTAVDITGVELAEVSGTPLLRVVGTAAGAGGSDVYLRLRQGSTVIDVPNTATAPGNALFEHPVTNLDTHDYELLVGSVSTGRITAIDAAATDLSQTRGSGGRTFGFASSSGRLVLTVAETPVAVTATSAQIVSVSGAPTLRVTGSVVGTPNGDAFLRIRSGVQTVNVANTSTVPGQAVFVYDLSGLTQLGTWYDLLVGSTSTGALVDLDTTVADVAQTVSASSKAYGFRAYGDDLKVAFATVSVTLSPTAAEILDVAGVPTLRVTGSFTNTHNGDLFLRVRTSDEVFDVPNTATTAGQFRFAFDLSALTKPGTWYDTLVGVSSTGALTNLTPAIATMSQTITVSERAYSFKQYNGQLKVNYDDVSVVVAVSSAQLLDVSGTPTLRVTGTFANTPNSDVYLRVRTGSTVVDVPNAASTAGQFSADYALTGLASPGTWYDVLIGVQSKSKLTDVPASAATLSQTVAQDGRTYALHSYGDGDLKVSYDQTLLGAGQSIRIDFGPNDVNDTTRDGNATVSPDLNGRYWNNVSYPDASAAAATNTSNTVPSGLSASGLRTTGNVVTTTRVTMNGTNWLSNGLNAGGLRTPAAGNLGELAVGTATQDYFFVQSSGTATLTLSGLDPYRLYDLKFYGTRITGTGNTPLSRTTTYTVVGANSPAGAPLQTSGSGSSSAAITCESGAASAPCYGNNATVVTVAGAQPTTSGTLTISVAATAGTFGYLGFLEITGGTALTPPVQIPAEVSRWVAQDAADPVASNSILFVGSSSIRRWESLTRDFADYDVIQRGWGGAHLSGVNDYFPWVVAPYDPDAIVMWAGTNDIRAGKTPERVRDDFLTFVADVRADAGSADADIFWISITPTPDYGITSSIDATRRQTNALMQAAMAGDPHLHYLDVATYFENLEASDPTAFHDMYVDGLHLSRAGYAQWLSIVRPAVAAVVAPNKAATANAATLQPGEKLLVDFGPSNSLDGDPTGTDVNGNRWNNWTATTGGGLVNVGEHNGGLVSTTGRDTGIGMTITGGFLTNGKRSGGLTTPSGALLGDLGVATATEDYFFSSADNKWGGGDDDVPGGFMLTGLDPNQYYDFHFFGSRDSTETRITEYAVFGANGRTAATLQTSGAGIGSNGVSNGNDDEVAIVAGVVPDAFGQVWIDVTLVQGSYAHLNAMEVFASPAPAAMAMSALTFCGAVDQTDPELGSMVTDGSPLSGELLAEGEAVVEDEGCAPEAALRVAGDPEPGSPAVDPAPPSPEPSAAPTGDPGPVATPAPEPEPTGTPEPEPTGTPEPEPTGTPEPEPTGTPEPAVIPGGVEPSQSGRRRTPQLP